MKAPMTFMQAAFPIKGDRWDRELPNHTRFRDHAMTPLGIWLAMRTWWHVEIDHFPRSMYHAPGARLGIKGWVPIVRMRLWDGPPHSTADRTVLKILFEVTL